MIIGDRSFRALLAGSVGLLLLGTYWPVVGFLGGGLFIALIITKMRENQT